MTINMPEAESQIILGFGPSDLEGVITPTLRRFDNLRTRS